MEGSNTERQYPWNRAPNQPFLLFFRVAPDFFFPPFLPDPDFFLRFSSRVFLRAAIRSGAGFRSSSSTGCGGLTVLPFCFESITFFSRFR